MLYFKLFYRIIKERMIEAYLCIIIVAIILLVSLVLIAISNWSLDIKAFAVIILIGLFILLYAANTCVRLSVIDRNQYLTKVAAIHTSSCIDIILIFLPFIFLLLLLLFQCF